MYSIWLFLKDRAKCTGKISDVRLGETKKKNQSVLGRKNARRKQLLSEDSSTGNFLLQNNNYSCGRLHDLHIGDPSRNVVEIIFRTSSMRHSKHTRNIERVLKVKNSINSLVGFEEYRESVKKKAYGQNIEHLRIVVDGNELLLFYNTTMSCCRGKLKRMSELCHNSDCGVCRINESGFDTKGMKRNGIQLSANSDTCSNKVVITNKKYMKNAAVVCRVIAGRVAHTVKEGGEEGFDSFSTRDELCTGSEHLFVSNPHAILPCFVILWT
ncbi:zinc finger (C2H2 type) family protein [Thalictrum thalictroides]|uniref:Zinc finger (C2H2 type) family protein n=1 Tax=Thalictrum thalictroides TaxID=46969 RepID=A0A7J6UYP7_THATH|nr:zinc finger (C2H2 type) family protein [Thalictrum thalictroides]